MRWLFYEKETEERARVVLIYPYEPTTVDMYDGYVFVENYQEPDDLKNKRSTTYCNPISGEYWHEYRDVSTTEEDTLSVLGQELASLKIQLIMGGVI